MRLITLPCTTNTVTNPQAIKFWIEKVEIMQQKEQGHNDWCSLEDLIQSTKALTVGKDESNKGARCVQRTENEDTKKDIKQ